MLSPTLTDGLERYEIGPKLRALRLKKKIGLVQLGKHTGLSSALLSKIERGHDEHFGAGNSSGHFMNLLRNPDFWSISKQKRFKDLQVES